MTRDTPKLWWCNQTDSYGYESEGIICVPQKSKDGRSLQHWERIKQVQPGDAIVHYVTPRIRAIGIAQNSVEPYEENQKWIVRVDYTELANCCNIGEIIKEDVRKRDCKVFDKNGNVKQGYLFELSHEVFVKIIKNNQEIRTIFESSLGEKFVEEKLTLVNDQLEFETVQESETIQVPSRVDEDEEWLQIVRFELESELKKARYALTRKKSLILQGCPGVGKTYIAKFLLRLLNESCSDTELVQFHPSYTYEDFIQGIRPTTNTSGGLTYEVVPGHFKKFCDKARQADDICVFIIDEINRANLSQVFGELMYLLEYRDSEIKLAGSDEPFSIPKNVRIIGTMNTADRSIALIDHALRRRFAFIRLTPNYNILRRYHEHHETGCNVEGLIRVLQDLNDNAIKDVNYQLGISYFLTESLQNDIADIWEMEVEPYLEEYFFDSPEKYKEFRWDNVRDRIEIAPADPS